MFRYSKFLLAIASLFLASVLTMASDPESSGAEYTELGLLSNEAILYGFLGSRIIR